MKCIFFFLGGGGGGGAKYKIGVQMTKRAMKSYFIHTFH